MSRLQSSADKVQQKLNKAGNDGSDAMQKISKGASTADSSLSKLAKTAATVFALDRLYEFGKGILKLGADMEQTKVSFETMLGSQSKANALISEITEMANATPFEKGPLLESAKLLLNFGMAGNKIMPTLKMLGDVSGGNEQRFQQLSLAFAQMSSAGKLTGQDLLQMINAGFNPLQEISDKTGRSMAELKEQMEKGGISSEMVTAAFQSATSEGGKFFQMLEKQSKTAAGLWSTLVGNIKEELTKLGLAGTEWLKPYLESAIQASTQIPAALQKISDWWDKWGIIVSGIAGAVAAYYYTVLSLTIVTKAWLAIQLLLNAAMLISPIGWLMIGIGALAGVIIYAWNKFEGFRETIMGLWEAFKYTFQNIGDVIKTFVSNVFSPFIEAWQQFKEGNYGAAAKALGKGVLGLTPSGLWDNFTKNADLQDAFHTGKLKAGIGKNVDEFGNPIDGVTKEQSDRGVWSAGSENPKNTSLNTDKILSTGIDNITGGGSKQTHITVSFENLIRENNINVNGVKQGVDDMTDQLINGLLRVLNSANAMASN